MTESNIFKKQMVPMYSIEVLFEQFLGMFIRLKYLTSEQMDKVGLTASVFSSMILEEHLL